MSAVSRVLQSRLFFHFSIRSSFHVCLHVTPCFFLSVSSEPAFIEICKMHVLKEITPSEEAGVLITRACKLSN